MANSFIDGQLQDTLEMADQHILRDFNLQQGLIGKAYETGQMGVLGQIYRGQLLLFSTHNHCGFSQGCNRYRIPKISNAIGSVIYQ
jgi:hypothetical protein